MSHPAITETEWEEIHKVMELIGKLKHNQQEEIIRLTKETIEARANKKFSRTLNSLLFKYLKFPEDSVNAFISVYSYKYKSADTQRCETIDLMIGLPEVSSFILQISQTFTTRDDWEVNIKLSNQEESGPFYFHADSFTKPLTIERLIGEVEENIEKLEEHFPESWHTEKIADFLSFIMMESSQGIRLTFQ